MKTPIWVLQEATIAALSFVAMVAIIMFSVVIGALLFLFHELFQRGEKTQEVPECFGQYDRMSPSQRAEADCDSCPFYNHCAKRKECVCPTPPTDTDLKRPSQNCPTLAPGHKTPGGLRPSWL